MSKYVQWITHKGKRILFLNVAGLSEADCLAGLEELKQALLHEEAGALVLSDFSNTEMSTARTKKSKEVAAATKAAGIPDGPSAVVGLPRLGETVAKMIARGGGYFEDLEEAKDWLVEEDERRHKR